jgi:hypothetical protein
MSVWYFLDKSLIPKMSMWLAFSYFI